MNPYSLLHLVAALAVLVIGLVMLRLRKGDRRHRVLGWWYVCLMSIGLIGIVIRTWSRPHPFMGYAVMILIVLSTAVGAPFYQMFNILIAVGTVAGLGVINTRLIIWGRAIPERLARWWYSALVVGSSTALIAAQRGMAFP
jgi:hypothetical protein